MIHNGASALPLNPIGVISVGGSSADLIPLLSASSVPLLVTSSEAAYTLQAAPTLFSATPHLSTQMQVSTGGRIRQRVSFMLINR